MKVDILTPDQTLRLGNRLWVLTAPFQFSVDDEIFTVPRGFITDGASTPRLLWSICSPVAGPFGQGAIAHDWFYNEGPDIGRLKADLILYHMGLFRGAGYARAQAVKSGVNLFGWMSYKKNKSKLTDKTCYGLESAKIIIKDLKNEYTTVT